ncbi:MAG: heat-inducible transcriptional repressor [Acidimicrobiaceae bacterium]|jgi:heat-inducible transcriptional repressor|nr:heat-inducible transcriptional repressor [Acidimicrobiaceae bacterium]MDQ1444338.1 heat-inducible transcriptional repressor [Acidimicrobiaceae bacterium]
MLDDRKAAILRAVVSEYIETAQPVGSQHVARQPGLAVSPATVRNEMAVLERDGYLVQPHTSAGRIPTDKGYRFFVDHLSAPGPLDPAKRQQVRDFFKAAHGEIERMLADTSRLLANVTDYAAVVVGPPHEAAHIRSVQLVGLAPKVALVVAVLSNGVVEKRTLELTEEAGEERLAAVGRHVSAHLVGRTLAEPGTPPSSGDDATDALVSQALSSLIEHEVESDSVFVGGASRMARAFDAVDTVRGILGILEEQFVVVGLLQDVLDRGLSVAIGAEHGLEPLSECAVVVAPYEVEGERAGTIGVLGPTRMNYPEAMAAVAVVSQRLGRHLSEG